MNKINLAKEYGTCLSSRVTGAKLRTRIDIGNYEIDFADVIVLSHSFADECFAVLVQDKGEEWFVENIKFINLEPSVRYSILEAILMRMANE